MAGQPAGRKVNSTYTGQLILGTDKRNPLFTVYVHEEDDLDLKQACYKR